LTEIWTHIVDLVSYSKESPLIFTRFYFWGFFAIVLFIYSLLHKQRGVRNAYLFAVSLFFYYKTSGLFVSILLFSTLADYLIGLQMHRTQADGLRKFWVGVSVFINLVVLSYFKYSVFFAETINGMLGTSFEPINYFAMWTNMATGSHFEVGKILLPVGISFFTFQTISYAVDVYRRDVEPVKNILDFGFYVSFFPQLVSGPIVRAAEFIPQLYKPFKLNGYQFGLAVYWILKGLTKKLLIGDYIAVNFIDRVFENPLSASGFEVLMSLYGYSLQVYCDFSGYTDIAIGIALLMGFRLPTNFNSPYKAVNVGDFWRRWHMSLSSWLKDYLYIPMGGNRGGSFFMYVALFFILSFIVLLSGSLKAAGILVVFVLAVVLLSKFIPAFGHWVRTNVNIMLTMLIGGLWHGSSWQFVIWGGLNGLGIVIYKLWKRISPWTNSNHWLAHFWGVFLTFNFITFTRIWFRGESMEVTGNVLHQLGTAFDVTLIPALLVSYKNVFLLMLLGFVVHWLPTSIKRMYRNWFIRTHVAVKVVIVTIVVFVVYQAISAELQPFIYFQF
jgi:D-alanyl-lipoteichoic acid acyltransferase DltB (MBOAT superfamily)